MHLPVRTILACATLVLIGPAGAVCPTAHAAETPATPATPATPDARDLQPRVPTATLPPGFVYRADTGAKRLMVAGASGPQPFLPLGLNFAWPKLPNTALEYELTIPLLAANGVNLIRVWHCTWGLNLGGWNAQGTLDGPGVAALDRVFKSAEKHGLKILLVYDNHYDVLNNQKLHGLFTASGAPGAVCATTLDYFTLPAARAIHAARLKAILTRYGNSPAFDGIELFNELDLTLQLDADHPESRAALETWARFLADVIAQERARGTLAAWHPVGLSTAWPKSLALYGDPRFDWVSVHRYLPEPATLRYDREMNETELIGDTCLYYDPERPVDGHAGLLMHRPWVMEYGLAAGGSTSPRNDFDPNGAHLRHALWASVAAGGEGSVMPWWWDSYVLPRGLTKLYRPLADATAGLPWDRQESAYIVHRPAPPLNPSHEQPPPPPRPTGADYFAYGTVWNDTAFLYAVRDDRRWVDEIPEPLSPATALNYGPRAFTLDAGILGPGRYAVEWINPATGHPAGPSATVEHPGGHLQLTTPPFLDDLAVIVHRVE